MTEAPLPLSAAEARILSLLLDRGLALPPPEREAWLQGLPPAQQPLVSRLRQRMADLAEPGQPAPPPPPPAPARLAPAVPLHPRHGERVGPYRLLRPLGSGTEGPLWQAESAPKPGARPRPVALLLAPDAAAAERQIVTLPPQAHTVRLQDAGIDASGRAYRVLPWVEGTGLLEHAERRGHKLAQRVALMLQVCVLVAHAHAEEVVHGDLRPANLRVDDEGHVTLLDWGRGRALRTDTVAAEVLALGELLRHLLGARKPGRDLAAVLRCATHADASQRYASVQALADELQRVLDLRPVLAAPAPAWHRAGLFLRRRRWALAAALLLALVLAGALTLGVRQLMATRAQDQRGQQVRDFLSRTQVEPADADIAVQAPRLQGALEQARSGFAGEPVLRGQAMTALGERFRALGQPEQALDVLREALTLLQGNARPGDPALHAAQLQVALQLLANRAPGAAAQAAALVQQALVGCTRSGADCDAVRALARQIQERPPLPGGIKASS